MKRFWILTPLKPICHGKKRCRQFVNRRQKAPFSEETKTVLFQYTRLFDDYERIKSRLKGLTLIEYRNQALVS